MSIASAVLVRYMYIISEDATEYQWSFVTFHPCDGLSLGTSREILDRGPVYDVITTAAHIALRPVAPSKFWDSRSESAVVSH